MEFLILALEKEKNIWYYNIVRIFIFVKEHSSFRQKKGQNMKLVEKTFIRGGCYSFLIALALLLVSKALGIDEYGNYQIVMNINLYLVCGVCGFVTALAGLVFETKLDPIFKRLIHFTVLLCGFVAIFATAATGSQNIPAKILIGTFVFTVCYAVLFLALFGIRKLIAFLEKKYTLKNKEEKPAEKYTPRYKQ